ncbi:hypothetical protein R4172_18190 [Rhodococcus kroppenstedtii]|uniref:Uncharacterized protein n=1 Tax=Rhodococcoides kroppenstedtii TaxID=293050 RepID=A0A1I0TUM1_9NOCA|nr:hypothetical protein [Rhodococcus kroppenstedtii]MDV7199476.1 hypothetical protein [Rhodococcus kroppenstedtii]SFA55293.1 hypothetical protein SAMN05444374_109179 [Rhodococcus kroppenstedtii]
MTEPRHDNNDDDGGLGEDNTIPDTDEGVAVGHSEDSTFEPEEDR